MAARAYWQGQIRLALVSIPVEIYTATKSGAKISFNQIHEPSGKPVKYEKVVPSIGPIDPDEIMKGYKVSKGEYVLLEDHEIEAVKIESRKTLELVQFVDQCEIDPLYFEKPDYVTPKDDLAEEAFVVLREALRKAKKVALGQLSVRGSEKLVAIKPCGKGLLLETLRCAVSCRTPQSKRSATISTKPSSTVRSIDTSGWSRENLGSRGKIKYAAAGLWALTRTRPNGRLRMLSNSSRMSSTELRAGCSLVSRICPASVGASERVVRLSRRMSRRASRFRIAWLKAEGDMPSRLAAAAKLPASTISANTASPDHTSRSIRENPSATHSTPVP